MEAGSLDATIVVEERGGVRVFVYKNRTFTLLPGKYLGLNVGNELVAAQNRALGLKIFIFDGAVLALDDYCKRPSDGT